MSRHSNRNGESGGIFRFWRENFLDELMETLKVIQPRLYDAFMAKIR